MSRRFSLPAWLAALALLALSMSSAPARSEGTATINCYGSGNSRSCIISGRRGRFHPHVITVPAPKSEQEIAAADARDRRWAQRCDPVIRHDRYGMPRYTYAVPGCEFGRLD